MGYFRFFRRVRIAPGVTVNLAKTGPSLSLGMHGAHVTVGRTGVRKTVGLPGSGCFYTSKQGWHSGGHTASHFANATPVPSTPASGWATAGEILGGIFEALGIILMGILGILLAFASAGSGRRRRRRW